MLSIIETLQSTYPNKSPKYISNLEIENFLNQNKAKIDNDSFKEIKDYFLITLKVSRSIFIKWEEENKDLFQYKERLQKSNRMFPLQKEFEDLLKIRKYSPRTIVSYVNSLLITNENLQKNWETDLLTATLEDFKEYFKYLIIDKKSSSSSIRIARFAIEYYRNEIALKPIRLDFAYGIRKEEHLPTIFTLSEIHKILQSITNLKHKMMISLLYSSGLRLSEVIHLKVKDIDTQEKIIMVREGKGKKDRMTILSEKIISDLSVFLEDRKPGEYVFVSNQKSGTGKDRPLTSRSVEHILEKALVRAKISKKGTPHDLRHSFATHLLESGTDIHLIQKLLGHKNISSTTIYTKLANPKVAGVKSPL
jgi:integrase/recombinase XerD